MFLSAVFMQSHTWCLFILFKIHAYQVPDNLSLLTVNKSCFHSFRKVNSQFETPGGRLNVFCLFCHLTVVVVVVVVVLATVINK
jgi:hypothetical protein